MISTRAFGICSATDRPTRGGRIVSSSPARTSVGAAICASRREGQGLLDDLLDGAVGVGARGVDPCEERLEKGALSGRHLGKPAPELELGAEQGVRASVSADEH